MWLSSYDINLADAQREIDSILVDYDIKPKKNEIIVYSEGKNDFLIQKFALYKAISGRAEKTIRAYVDVIKRFLIAVGKDADTVTTEDIQQYIAQILIKGNTKSYADTVRRYLGSFFGYLSREELINKNPISKVEKIKFSNEKEKAFSDFEIEMLRNACKNNREKAIIEVLLSTGCRASEACSLRIDDINDGKAIIKGKGGKFRTVYFNAKCQVAIDNYLKERRDNNPYLFPLSSVVPTDKNDKMRKVKSEWYRYPDLVSKDRPADGESINHTVSKIGSRANVDKVHAHRFRRTCATMALRRGMALELVSKMLGHEELTTTQIYLDLREEDLENAHNKYVY